MWTEPEYCEICDEPTSMCECPSDIKDLSPAPREVVELIKDAMIKYGPDGHCDGAEIIAKLVNRWYIEVMK